MTIQTVEIIPGNVATITANFVDADDTPADPTTVEVIVEEPDGVRTVYTSPTSEITNPGVGKWVFVFPSALTKPGTWSVWIGGTAGLVTGEIHNLFVVDDILG